MEILVESMAVAPLEIVYSYYADTKNLPLLMKDWPGFRLLHHGHQVEVGKEVWFEQMVAGCVPVVLGFRHVEVAAPYSFTDELVHGPFREFVHHHEFEAHGQTTLIRDRVELRLPIYYGGEWATHVFVKEQMLSAFRYRHQRFCDLAERGKL